MNRLADVLAVMDATADRAIEALEKIDAIASEVVSDPGCKLGVVEKVRHMADEVVAFRATQSG